MINENLRTLEENDLLSINVLKNELGIEGVEIEVFVKKSVKDVLQSYSKSVQEELIKEIGNIVEFCKQELKGKDGLYSEKIGTYRVNYLVEKETITILTIKEE